MNDDGMFDWSHLSDTENIKKEDCQAPKKFDWSYLSDINNNKGECSQALKNVFNEVVSDFDAKLSKHTSDRRQRLVIAGGNYSSLFFFPRLLKTFALYDKRFKIELKLFEPSSKSDLKGVDFDILFAAEYSKKRKVVDMRTYVDMGYHVSDIFMEDYSYFAVTKTALEKYGNVEGVVNNLPLLVARSILSSEKQKVFNWNFKPKGKEGEMPKIVSDQFFFSYQMMKLGYGIWFYTDSLCDPDIVKIEEKPRLCTYRYIVYKEKAYRPLVDKMIKVMKRRKK